MYSDEESKFLTDYLLKKKRKFYYLVKKNPIFKKKGWIDDMFQELCLVVAERFQKVVNRDRLDYLLANYWILEAKRKFFVKYTPELKLKKPQNIKDFKKKVNLLIKGGYEEAEAKMIVRSEASFQDLRLMASVDIGKIESSNPHDKDSDNGTPWYDIIRNPDQEDFKDPEEETSELEERELIKKALAFCIDDWKKDAKKPKPVKRTHQILKKKYLKKTSVEDLAKKYKISESMIYRIIREVKPFLDECVRNQLHMQRGVTT